MSDPRVRDSLASWLRPGLVVGAILAVSAPVAAAASTVGVRLAATVRSTAAGPGCRAYHGVVAEYLGLLELPFAHASLEVTTCSGTRVARGPVCLVRGAKFAMDAPAAVQFADPAASPTDAPLVLHVRCSIRLGMPALRSRTQEVGFDVDRDGGVTVRDPGA
ncbi:MAG: hypothetical protein ACYDGR_08605 [Candidatus Dormibacteria bacterium]